MSSTDLDWEFRALTPCASTTCCLSDWIATTWRTPGIRRAYLVQASPANRCAAADRRDAIGDVEFDL